MARNTNKFVVFFFYTFFKCLERRKKCLKHVTNRANGLYTSFYGTIAIVNLPQCLLESFRTFRYTMINPFHMRLDDLHKPGSNVANYNVLVVKANFKAWTSVRNRWHQVLQRRRPLVVITCTALTQVNPLHGHRARLGRFLLGTGHWKPAR